MLPTVAEVLALDVMRRGEPRVVAGTDRLGTLVRWVHAIELADAARLLRGGELVLTTGIALPDEGPLLDAYVAGLASVGIAGLAVELGRRYTGGLPASFVTAAESHRLPLIDGYSFRDIHRQRRLLHVRSGRDDQHFSFVHAAGHFI